MIIPDTMNTTGRPTLNAILIIALLTLLGSCDEKSKNVTRDVRIEAERVSEPVADFVAGKLDYNFNIFSGWVSTKILDAQRKEQQTHAENLNRLRSGTPYAYLEIETLLAKTPAEEEELLQAAAGYYNHELFFNTIQPGGAQEPMGFINAGMGAEFGGYRWFKANLLEMAEQVDGKGWIFLNTDKVGTRMWLTNTSEGRNPLMKDIVDDPGYPIAALDLTPGSYSGSLENYVNGFIKRINWTNVEENLKQYRPKS
jgi:Fe-Mn family superoxide dismutase